jgi:hypothetical protein
VPSRLKTIRTDVEAHVSTAISGVTITNEPASFDTLPTEDFPHARVLFVEEDPERLDYKQERRTVNGQIAVAVLRGGAQTVEAAREVVDQHLEDIRDAIFGDEDLGATVDDISCESAAVFSSSEDPIVYGTLEITTVETF